ncbi:MAG: histidine phosphatase family protein [Verrucomicrobia bacterium]|nr:histidine phosphatase family protein [Verrucomicrobiota bacterium]
MFGHRKLRALSTAAPPSLEIHLVRHAQAHNDNGIDTHGPELTPHGRRQARRLAKRLTGAQYTGIYSSDLTRARQTADAIALHHADNLLTVTRDLREVSGQHTALHMSRLTINSDRSLIEEQQAMHRVINHLRETHEQGERVLIVSHGNITRSLIPLLGGLAPAKAPLLEIYNASLSIVDAWPSGRAVVRLANCVAHLPERLIT